MTVTASFLESPPLKAAVMNSTDLEGQIKNDISSKEIEHASIQEDFSPEEEKMLLRKIDLMLLPTIWIMYLLSYLDRTKYAIPPRVSTRET